jgi:hypothetical protein
VNDSKPVSLSLNVAKIIRAAMVYERVYQCPVAMLVRRMAYKAYLLGQDDEVLVFVSYVKRDGLARHRRDGLNLLNLIHDRLTCANGLLLRSGFA